MTQEQLNIICKVLRNGAPALAEELISSIGSLLRENTELRNKLDEINSNKQKDLEKTEETK